jgi:Mn-dependent DtxR family transcriptional regulator
MRKSGKWMTIVDDRILEYIRENEHGSASEMKREGPIRYSRGYISERCKKLAEHGLLTPVGNGVYVITERGEKYLDAELDTHVDKQDNGPGNAESGEEIEDGSEESA